MVVYSVVQMLRVFLPAMGGRVTKQDARILAMRRAPIHAQLHAQLHAPIHAPPVKVRDSPAMIHHARTLVNKEHVRLHAPTHVDIPVVARVDIRAQSRAGGQNVILIHANNARFVESLLFFFFDNLG